jgi:hypothetical protein
MGKDKSHGVDQATDIAIPGMARQLKATGVDKDSQTADITVPNDESLGIKAGTNASHIFSNDVPRIVCNNRPFFADTCAHFLTLKYPPRSSYKPGNTHAPP